MDNHELLLPLKRRGAPIDKEKAAADLRELMQRLEAEDEKRAFMDDMATAASVVWDTVIAPRLEEKCKNCTSEEE